MYGPDVPGARVVASPHVVLAAGSGHGLLGLGPYGVLIVVIAVVLVRVALRARRRPPDPPEVPSQWLPPATGAATGGPSLQKTPVVAPTAGDAVLVVRELTVAYGPKTAVDQLSFDIRRREIFGLLGPNGAGKTSTLSAIEGLLRPRGGSVHVDGIDVRAHPLAARARLGVQLQATSFQDELTITQIVRLYAGLYGVEITDADIAERLRTSGLGGHGSRPFRHLSGGQQQRLSLLVALIHDPVLLLLDEPTTGLDPQSRRQLWRRMERIRDGGGSILLTTHSMEEAQAVCDRVAIVDAGRLLALGAPRELIAAHRDDPLVLAAAHGDVTLEDVFIGLTGGEIRD
jgi:ABC-2 type transport system ATP-binding protein